MQTQKAPKTRLKSHPPPENHRITPRNAQKITQNHAPSEGNNIRVSRRIRLQAPSTSVNSCLEKNPAAQKSRPPVVVPAEYVSAELSSFNIRRLKLSPLHHSSFIIPVLLPLVPSCGGRVPPPPLRISKAQQLPPKMNTCIY
jgi:hypothetical protein